MKILFILNNTKGHCMDEDDILGMFNTDDEDEPAENSPRPEQMIVNKNMSKEITDNELGQWVALRNSLTYTQNWQDIALNAESGSSYVVSTQ